METFLRSVARKIIDTNHFGPNNTVILPNRRSIVFLKQELSALSKNSILLPEIIPINEFIINSAKLNLVSDQVIYFELFNIHKQIAKENARSIDDFMLWAPLMLRDFNDIDNSLANASDIFKHLNEVKAIQQWNPDGRQLSESQLDYLAFFNSLIEYYERINNYLKEEKRGYYGMICRYLNDNFKSLFTSSKDSKFLFAGLNALTACETEIIRKITEQYPNAFIWDVDNYYFNDKNNERNDAGRKIQNIIKNLRLDYPENVNNDLMSGTKDIEIIEVAKNTGQTKYIADFLFNNDQQNIFSEKTAIVLADESLLIPLLNALPEYAKSGEAINYNITLGYPLTGSAAESFTTSVLDLHYQNVLHKSLGTSTLISLLTNPVIRHIIGRNYLNIIEEINKYNNDFIPWQHIKNLLEKSLSEKQSFIIPLFNFSEEITPACIASKIRDFLLKVLNSTNGLNKLIKVQIQKLTEISGIINSMLPKEVSEVTFLTIRNLYRQLIRQSRIDLIGMPLSGIQVMGLLETRALDFENVLILSSNEGTLPVKSEIDSFIPMDIRRYFKLPLPKDSNEIYSYHFYRLIQKAGNIRFLVNSESDVLGGGEKSRFILQIENELVKQNSKIKLTHKILSPKTDKSLLKQTSDICIIKGEAVNEKLNKIAITGYSPSALTTYISCPLRFYFSYILRIDTTPVFSNNLEANTFGTVVHDTLEQLYLSLKNKVIEKDNLNSDNAIVQKEVARQFEKSTGNSHFNTGRNLLLFETACKYVSEFLSWDKKRITSQTAKLISVEDKLITTLETGNGTINFKGTLDRVDEIIPHGSIQIIDYKTGAVNSKELFIKDIEELFVNPDYSKAFQVLYYAWIFNKKYKINNIESGIVSLRNLSNGYMKLQVKDYDKISDVFETFEENLLKLVGSITETLQSFKPTNDEEQCKYCNFKNICNR